MTSDAKPLTPRLAWQARASARRAGVPGAVAVGVLAAVLMVYLGAVRPAAQASAALQREIAAVEALRHAPPDAAGQRPADPVQQLADFYRFFPKTGKASDNLVKLHEVAALHGLQMEQGSYRLLRDRGGKLSLYEITLPVKGEYPQLRKFMSQALAELPHLALDSVSFQRQKAGDATLESQIKFTLFFSEAS